MTDLGWWIIHGDEILESFYRIANGENPDLVYAELYANCEVHEGDLNAEEI